MKPKATRLAGVRDELVARYRGLAERYDWLAYTPWTEMAERLEAGDTVEVAAWEIGMDPSSDRYRIGPDGTLVRVER